MSEQKHAERVLKFLEGYSAKGLLEEYSLSQHGLWQIFGEDPNCDLGGSHVTPLLETVEGKLGDVISYAVELPRFWQWGGGGRIEAIHAKKIDKNTVEEKLKLEEEAEQLEKKLESLRNRIKRF
jgi:hypothetical protein